jgi:hypothetical protein
VTGLERNQTYQHLIPPEDICRLAESRWDTEPGIVKFFDKDGERREESC